MSLSALLDSPAGAHTPDWRLSVDGVDITGKIAAPPDAVNLEE